MSSKRIHLHPCAQDIALTAVWLLASPMAQAQVQAISSATVLPTTRHFEEDRFLFSMTQMPDDFYFWAGVVSGFGDVSVQTFPLDLSGHAGGDMHLKVRLMGWSSSTNDPDHLARFAFNGAAVGELAFDDQDVVEAELAIPAAAVAPAKTR